MKDLEELMKQSIEIEKSPELLEAVDRAGGYLYGLRLDVAENDEFVRLMTEVVGAALKSGFMHGFKFGTLIMDDRKAEDAAVKRS